MKTIQVLGTGCVKCQQLAANAEAAATALGIEYRLEKITDVDRIVDLGVMQTPALAVDGVVLHAGKVISAEAIEVLLG